MARVACTGIVGIVTTIAGVRRIRIIAVVAGITIVCDGNVCAREGINGIVIKGRRRPGGFTMTCCTIRWELLGYMVWIGGLGVLRIVAAVAGIGCIVVIAVVTSCAVVGNRGMCAIQGIERIMNRETCGFPTGRGGVAHGAIHGEIELRVVGIACLGIICVMTTVAGVWRIVKVAVVAGITIVGNGDMRTGKRINRTMIEGRRRPGCFCMAHCTIRGELGCGVVWIGGLGVLRIVTAVAGIGRIAVIAVVAGSTIRCNSSMRAV